MLKEYKNPPLFDVIAVVVTFNRPELLRRVIEAVKEQTVLPSKIIIIDNNSDQPLFSWFQEQSVLDIHRLPNNTGGAGGFAEGIKIAHSYDTRWTWLLDDDAIPEKGALENLLITAQNNKNVGAVCSTIFENGIRAAYHHKKFNFSTGKETPIDDYHYSEGADVSIDTGSFASMLISTAVVSKIGLPHGYFFLGYDDTDYCLRIKKAGFLIFLSKLSCVNHLGCPLGVQTFSNKHYFHIRNYAFVLNEHTNSKAYAFMRSTIFALKVWRNSLDRFRLKSLLLLTKAWLHGIINLMK